MGEEAETLTTDRHIESSSPNTSEAVAKLFVEHNSDLIRFLRLRSNSYEDAREVAQEAYVRLLQLDKPCAIPFLRAYLFQVAAHLAIDRLRHARLHKSAIDDPAFNLAIDEVHPERASAAWQQIAVVDAGLKELPRKVREAFLLQRLNGISAAEAGRRLGLNKRTASFYVAKAMLHCRKRVDQA